MSNPDYFSTLQVGRRAWITGLCSDLARALDLPVGVVRAVVLVFSVLPTGFTYLALSLLANQRRARVAFTRPAPSYRPSAPPPPAWAFTQDWVGPRARFADLESRLNSMEAFVSSKDFELHKGFRQMRS
jgi:phage shock protein PspC (stress-responsive transcriptional regulator)